MGPKQKFWNTGKMHEDIGVSKGFQNLWCTTIHIQTVCTVKSHPECVGTSLDQHPTFSPAMESKIKGYSIKMDKRYCEVTQKYLRTSN
jgi:hypothetical protein